MKIVISKEELIKLIVDHLNEEIVPGIEFTEEDVTFTGFTNNIQAEVEFGPEMLREEDP